MGSFTAAAIGYGALGAAYVAGALISWSLVGEPPFRPDEGGLTRAWMAALLMNVVVASLIAGWVCRRMAKGRRALFVLVGILIGLLCIVAAADALIGPSPSARVFVERLFGSAPDVPLAALLDGRPQAWFVVASYAVAVVGMFAGGKIAERGKEPRHGGHATR